jgi:polyisoprenyl-teichoic acid--peptidoglycan teichoic acid transferase
MRFWGAAAATTLLAWLVTGTVSATPPGLGGQAGGELGRVLEAAFSPDLRSRERLFVLVIGSDARPGQAVDRARADSLHVIGVNVRKGAASILGIPRDSYVPIPGAGTQKINAALFHGGPELTERTVERLTGIRIDAYVLTGFEGLSKMVTSVGGVRVTVPYPMNDPLSRARFRPGPTRMTGPEALAFSRDRHDVPGGDLGRSLNQGRLIAAALGELRDDARRDPVTLFRWLAAAGRYLRTDMSLEEMLDLLLASLSIDPAKVPNRVVSGSGASVGGQSVVRLGSSARETFRDLRRDAILGG